ncbi:hypothetical protein GNI_090530 [Gregarina niphandrodes]|uniref:Uncharacterized protein n=1 Tax=Gregarina niphandrodes TaxID=110365 RepID=A0A023B5I1_GRENI|nr:hypothetical protein GNI_090530 [Gregarina niphandrodes]EZG60423.1 hypothetical protein GNI_090530 [Gregarina niphandrodes]|eukprot:XP_011130831.1 hypothetical protein GNI_090530 [Gregarina niphandrodes]
MARAILGEKKSGHSVSAALALVCIDAPNTRMMVRGCEGQQLSELLSAGGSPEMVTIRPAAVEGAEPGEQFGVLHIDDVLRSEEVKRLAATAHKATGNIPLDVESHFTPEGLYIETKNSGITNGNQNALNHIEGTRSSDGRIVATLHFGARKAKPESSNKPLSSFLWKNFMRTNKH